MARVYNFSAGPAAMPESVLREIADEMLDYRGSGMSVMEMSHRSPVYQGIIDDAEATLRRLLSIPDNYRVLFLQGGATLEFAAIPLNLMRMGKAGYVISGNFAKKAWEEAQKYGEAVALASSEDASFTFVPEVPEVPQDLDYVHICYNNTIFGTMTRELPETGNVPLVADVSSCFLSMPMDVQRFGLIYAGVQKNAGPGGLAVVIVRDDLIADGPALADICPTYLNFKLQAAKGSMYNTPNCWAIYVCGKIFHWVEDLGGLDAMERLNWEKVQPLYDFLDQSQLFRGTADPAHRSIANVCFRTGDADLDAQVVAGAKERSIVNVKGHRMVGGMRASCYNAVPKQAVDALIGYLTEFEADYLAQNPEAARSC